MYPATDLTGTGIDLHSGDVFNVAMNYDGTTLNVTITDTEHRRDGQPVVQHQHPVGHRRQRAYVGFTGGTGGLYLGPGCPELDLYPGSALDQHRQFRVDQQFRRPRLGVVLCPCRRCSSDKLQPGRHPGCRLRPSQQHVRHGPAA